MGADFLVGKCRIGNARDITCRIDIKCKETQGIALEKSP